MWASLNYRTICHSEELRDEEPAVGRRRAALRLYQKLPLPHNLLVIHPNIELPPDHVNVRSRIPLSASMRPVRIPKRNVHARILLVLQNLPNHFPQIDVGSNGKLAHA